MICINMPFYLNFQEEKIKSQYKQIKSKINYHSYTQINNLKVINNKGSWESIENEDQINDAILDHTKNIR